MNEFMNEALKQAKKAYKKGEVPIGCVIVKNEKIISRGYNKKHTSNDVTCHAEIIAIKKACKKLKNWRLNDCTIYSTMEPCHMCFGAITQSRIGKLVYGIENEKFGAVTSNNNTNNGIEIEKNILQNECLKIVQKFFEEKRIK